MPGTDPPGPVIVRIPQPPARPEVRTVPDEIQIQEPEAGTSPLASLRLLTAANLTAAPQLDDSQETNPVDAGNVIYDEGGWSTNLPWTRANAWYWIEAIDTAGRATRSLPFWGGDQADHELTLGGEIDPDRLDGLPDSSLVVEVRLDAAVTKGSRTYTRQRYRGVISRTSGQWQVTELPRGEVIMVKLPYGEWERLQLPANQATATYGELEPPTS